MRRQRVTPKCVEMKRGGSSPPRRLEVRCSIQLSYRRVRDLRYTGSTARRVRRSYAEVLHRPTADESFDSRLEVIRCQVRVPLDHAECPPAAEVLHRPQVNTCHDEPGRERVAVAVPCVTVEPARVLPCRLERNLSPLDGLREEARPCVIVNPSAVRWTGYSVARSGRHVLLARPTPRAASRATACAPTRCR